MTALAYDGINRVANAAVEELGLGIQSYWTAWWLMGFQHQDAARAWLALGHSITPLKGVF